MTRPLVLEQGDPELVQFIVETNERVSATTRELIEALRMINQQREHYKALYEALKDRILALAETACEDCGRPYHPAIEDAEDWELSDPESPVCPRCVRKWTANGGGYYRCTGCGMVILGRAKIVYPAHLAEDGKSCGRWVRTDRPRTVVTSGRSVEEAGGEGGQS